jgi:hypothetical protein
MDVDSTYRRDDVAVWERVEELAAELSWLPASSSGFSRPQAARR